MTKLKKDVSGWFNENRAEIYDKSVEPARKKAKIWITIDFGMQFFNKEIKHSLIEINILTIINARNKYTL